MSIIDANTDEPVQTQPMNEVPDADSVVGAKLFGLDSDNRPKNFRVSDIKGDYKGLADPTIQYPTPILQQYYRLKPGVTYPFLGGISVPVMDNGEKVIVPEAIWSGTEWKLNYESFEAPEPDITTVSNEWSGERPYLDKELATTTIDGTSYLFRSKKGNNSSKPSLTSIDWQLVGVNKNELVKKQALTTIYSHPRGDAEMQGNAIFADTTKGFGFSTQMTASGFVNRVVIPGYALANNAMFLRIYKTPGYSRDPSDATGTLLYSKDFSIGEFNTVAGLTTLIIEPAFQVITGEYIAIYLYTAVGSNPVIKYWNVDSTDAPLRGRFLRAPATNTWTSQWSTSALTFFAAPIKLLFNDSFLEDTVNNAVDSKLSPYRTASQEDANLAAKVYSKAETSLAISKSFSDFKASSVSYNHPRGDAEVLGNTYFGGASYYGLGQYELMTSDKVFNQITIGIYKTGDLRVGCRIYASPNQVVNFSTLTPLWDKIWNLGEFNPNNENTYQIDLGVDISIAANNYLYVLFYKVVDSGAGELRIREFNIDASTEPLRRRFYFKNSSVNIWTTNWGLSQNNLYSASFKLIFSQSKFLNEVKVYVNEGSATPVVSSPRITLPEKIYAVVGNQLTIYYANIAILNERGISGDGYKMTALCTIGHGYGDYYQVTPALAGNYSLTFKAYDYSKKLIEEKSTILTVVDTALPAVDDINFLPIGDSTTSPSIVDRTIKEKIDQLLGSSGKTFNVCGTRDNTVPRTEGIGGWTFADFAGPGRNLYRVDVTGITSLVNGADYIVNSVTYRLVEQNLTAGIGYLSFELRTGSGSFPATGTLTKSAGTGQESIPYTNGVTVPGNKLYNGSTGLLDVMNYRTANNTGLPPGARFQIVTIRLGINDIGQSPIAVKTDTELLAFITDAKKIISAFIADNSSTKIIIHIPTTMNITGGGTNSDDHMVNLILSHFRFRELLIANFDKGIFNANVFVGFAAAHIHRYYGYPNETRVISSRYPTVTIPYNTNAVHPVGSGYQEMGDNLMAQVWALMKTL